MAVKAFQGWPPAGHRAGEHSAFEHGTKKTKENRIVLNEETRKDTESFLYPHLAWRGGGPRRETVIPNETVTSAAATINGCIREIRIK